MLAPSEIRLPSLREKIAGLLARYREASALRNDVLFSAFLPTGYRQTTLSSVCPYLFEEVIFAKVHLGMLITLYDDFADHPQLRNRELLALLYRLNLGTGQARAPLSLTKSEREVFFLARYLLQSLEETLAPLPHFSLLLPLLQFDIEQFYSSSRYAELVTEIPEARNLTEMRCLGPHNMGMVAAGTIDLMASPRIEMEELGQCREILTLGQRLGRICNLLHTAERERKEGDSTSELLFAAGEKGNMEAEFRQKLGQIRGTKIRTFDTAKFAGGLVQFRALHASLEGRI